MTDELTPEEQALRAEGEGFLRAITGKQQGRVIVPGAKSPEAEKPSERLERSRQEEAALVQQAAVKLREITEKDEVARKCTEVMLACHQLLFWAKMELAACGDTTDFVVDVAERIMHAKVESAHKGFDLREVHARMKHYVIPFVQDRMKEYMLILKKRQNRLKRLNRGLSKSGGITLPAGMSKKFEQGFKPGDVLVLVGGRGAVRIVLGECARAHVEEDRGKVYYLSAKQDYKPDVECCFMPPAWWTNACSSLNQMDSVFGTIVNDEAALMLVEDLSLLYVAGEGNPSTLERRVMALKRVYAWAKENMVAVVVGDEGIRGIPHSQLYQLIPYVPVFPERVDGSLVVNVGGNRLPAPGLES